MAYKPDQTQSEILIDRICKHKQNKMHNLALQIKQLQEVKQGLHDEVCRLRAVQAQIGIEKINSKEIVESLCADVQNLKGEILSLQKRGE